MTARGHATTAPPTSEMNSRRSMRPPRNAEEIRLSNVVRSGEAVVASQRGRAVEVSFGSRTVHATRLRRFENASLAPYKAAVSIADRCQRAVALGTSGEV